MNEDPKTQTTNWLRGYLQANRPPHTCPRCEAIQKELALRDLL